MVASPPIVPETADQRIILYGVPWSHFEAELALRGDKSAPRICYLEGAMELMSPSSDHERIKSYIARLIDAYALDMGIEFTPYGSWALKNAPKEAGAEPDECYVVGADRRRDVPDVAIEVIWTSGGLEKLEIYRRLGVAEVLVWKDGRIEVHALRGPAYERVEQSRFFPGLDFELLATFIDQPTASAAIRAFRQALAPKKSPRRPRRPRR